MKFVDRVTELRELEQIYALSRNRLFPVVIFGPRRIGKTELIKQFAKDKKRLYFFIYGLKTSQSLLKEFEADLKGSKVLEKREILESWEDFIDVLFERCGGYVLIFDEFQNFRDVYPPIFSYLQRKIDENQSKKIMFVFLGSVIGLIKRVFEDLKAPLYGRIKSKIKLDVLSYADIKDMMKNLNYRSEEDFVAFYSIFGGYPKYYAAIEDFCLEGKDIFKVLRVFFLKDNGVFAYEVLDILRQEFGKRKGTYYSILEAIATGHTKINEIATYVGLSITSITRYLRDLIDYYETIERITPITERKAKGGFYRIKNPLMRFWFRYFHRNLSLFEGKSYDELEKIIKKDLCSFVGYGFEEICMQILDGLNNKKELSFKFTKIGRWWHRQEEIDIVALNEETEEILFCECKWQDNVNAKKVLRELKEKAKLVDWRSKKEYFYIIAKSFANKTEDALCFDLRDIEKVF